MWTIAHEKTTRTIVHMQTKLIMAIAALDKQKAQCTNSDDRITGLIPYEQSVQYYEHELARWEMVMDDLIRQSCAG